ncbi:rhomboid family intramembrane serine protease, partial [Chloroflexota bacterium]
MFPISDPDLFRLRLPIVNLSIIALCTAVFLYEQFLGGIDRDLFFFRFGLIPAELTQGVDYTTVSTRSGPADISTPFSNWITMFSSMFIHGGWLHFLSNMLFLWVFGDNIEDRFGRLRYLVFYLGAGIAAAWMQIAIDVDSQVPMIGASG